VILSLDCLAIGYGAGWREARVTALRKEFEAEEGESK
jgi:hypothetical protein